MYTLVKTLPVRQTLTRHLPAVAVSIGLAETFYKFHSFSLECLAFLATWWVIDAAMEHLGTTRRKATLLDVAGERAETTSGARQEGSPRQVKCLPGWRS